MRVFFLLLLSLLISCSPSPERDILEITSWNAYCFFDGSENGTEYSEFKSSGGYTRDKYNKRVEKTALYMIETMRESSFIILEEIESSDVLYDLIEAGLKNVGFVYYGLAQTSDGALSVGFISKIKPSSFKFHSTPDSRPIMEINFLYNGEMVVLLAVHLRSQLDTSSTREIELELLRTIVEEREGENIIIIGDFNTDCISGSEIGDRRLGNDYILSLTGDGMKARGGTLFSPYLDYGTSINKGSYYYDGEWYTYDNALLTSSFFDGNGLEYLDFRIVAGADAKTTSGLPLKYDKSTGTGYSDHFAITLRCSYY